jgi:predicted O-methyltransferase YrrM
MNRDLYRFLGALHREGQEHDAREADRTVRYRNLDPDTAHYISMQLLLMNATSVVELGTSNGYSTIWMADAVQQTGGRLVTVDIESQAEAIANLEKAGLSNTVQFVRQDGGAFLASLPDESVDVLFLDAERTRYVEWWPHPYRVLRTGGLMLVDNAHHPAPDELVDFVKLINNEPRMDHLTLMTGSGLILARKS